MLPKNILPTLLIALPLAALAFANCGIVALPIAGPNVIAKNAKTLALHDELLALRP